MSAPVLGVCEPWTTDDDLSCDTSGVDPEIVADAISAASDILYVLSGRQFPGECEDVVRPCARRRSGYQYSRFSWGTWEWDRSWGVCGCSEGDRCGCSALHQIGLRAPVAEVTEVRVDGVVLDADAYRVDDWRWLVRLDGEGWPCCQDLVADASEPGTFEVTYTFGTAPPAGGGRSAGALACELVLAWGPDEDDACRLPKRVRQIVRQGVTIAVDNPTEVFDAGMTGIPEVDLWLRSVNPKTEPAKRAMFMSPDVRPRKVRRVGT